MRWLLEPSLRDASEELRTRWRSGDLQGRTVILAGRCSVSYHGRARSTLAAGDRVVLIKADGTLLIHNPKGFKPVNWQPPGCRFEARLEGNDLLVEARRGKPPEIVKILFDRVAVLGSIRLSEESLLELTGTEFNVRDALRRRPDLIEEGFVPWEPERITDRGPVDLYGEDAQGRRVVVEVKRKRAGIAEATQLWRYVEQERKKRSVDVRGILVAPAASERAHALLKDHGLEFCELSVEALEEHQVALTDGNQMTLSGFVEHE